MDRGLARARGAKHIEADRLQRIPLPSNTPSGLLSASPAQLEHAHALTELGAALRRHDRKTQARRVLARASTWRIAVAPGGAPRRRRADPQRGPRRRMAADGQTNREIAQALFVTAGTVETHLSSVYRKLDVSARSSPGALALVRATSVGFGAV